MNFWDESRENFLEEFLKLYLKNSEEFHETPAKVSESIPVKKNFEFLKKTAGEISRWIVGENSWKYTAKISWEITKRLTGVTFDDFCRIRWRNSSTIFLQDSIFFKE